MDHLGFEPRVSRLQSERLAVRPAALYGPGGTQTHGLLLARETLYQSELRGPRWTERDLNPWPLACQASVLPTELSAHVVYSHVVAGGT